MLHQIGVGALGPVFRTYEPDRDRLVAVKAFRVDLTPEQAQSLAEELSRVAEAGLFHPSIVEPIAAGVEGSVAYNAEEYVAAESLDVAMRHYAPAAIDTVLPFITQLAGAIDFARAAGVGHGALHPRDIFITPDEARVTGFGIVEALERVGFRAPVRRPYTPPERIEGGSWATSADVFSLAAVTYELLTARRPAGLGAEIGALTPGALDTAAAGALHTVLARGLDADPSRRYPTALAFAAALEDAAHTARAESSVVTAEAPPQTAAAPLHAPAAAVVAQASSSSPQAPAEAAVQVVADEWQAESVRTARDAPEAEALKLEREELEREEEEEEEEDARDDDDIALERDVDVAHHQLSLREADAAAAREQIAREQARGLDADSEVEAEADRFTGDDFLLDAAGAASGAGAELDDFRRGDGSDRRLPLDDDSNDPPEVAPPPVVRRWEPLERDVRLPPPARGPGAGEPAAVAAAAPMFGGSRAEPERSSSRLPLALTLVFGLLVGLVGGYALWGRGSAPGTSTAREFSEQPAGGRQPAASAPASAGPSTPPAPSSPSGSPAAGSAAATSGSTAKPNPRSDPPPSVSEPVSGTGRPAATRSASARGSAARKPTGTIVIRSTPAGAGVTVNGRWRGRTPLAVESLPFARYDVRVVQSGFAPAREAVTLSAADPDGTVSVRLQPEGRATAPAPGRSAPAAAAPPSSSTEAYTGSVFVDSRPRGAKVFIDGKEVGSTPVGVPAVRIGSHVVRLELPDHRTWTSTTTVSAGRQSRVTGSLDRIQ